MLPVNKLLLLKTLHPLKLGALVPVVVLFFGVLPLGVLVPVLAPFIAVVALEVIVLTVRRLHGYTTACSQLRVTGDGARFRCTSYS